MPTNELIPNFIQPDSFFPSVNNYFEGQSPEELLDYHNKTNTPIWDNTFYAGYISGGLTKPVDPKLNRIGKKEKLNPPKFSTNAKLDREYSLEDNTIDLSVEKSTANANKLKFIKEIESLNLSNEDSKFLLKLAGRESSFRQNPKENPSYYGYYQLGKAALRDLNLTKEDLKNPINQHLAVLKLRDMYMIPLRKYIGQTINGVTYTKNKLGAMAHLAGPSGAKDYLEGTRKSSFAKKGFKDGYGTSIKEYEQLFI